MTEGFISLRAFAKKRGVSLKAVQKAIASGRVKSVERQASGRTTGIHEERASAEWNANTDPVEAARNGKLDSAVGAPAPESTPGAPVGGGESAPTPGNNAYLEARARREHFEAQSAELDYLRQVGELVSARELHDAAFRRYRTLRDKLLNVPDRVATILAAERDPVTIHRLLTEELKRVLNELSDGARSEVAGGNQERLAA